MSKEIEQTDIKNPVSRKYRPRDHTENEKTMTFTDELSTYMLTSEVIKRYPIKTTLKSFTFGKAYLTNQGQQVPFRVFHDADLNIPLIFQQRLQQAICDDDVQTTASQIEHAKNQNQKDIVQAIYKKEKPIDDDDADSLFASQQFASTSKYYQYSTSSSQSQ